MTPSANEQNFHYNQKDAEDSKKKFIYILKKKDIVPTLRTFQDGGEAHREAPIVYGCNIDFYTAHRKRELHPKLPRRLREASAAGVIRARERVWLLCCGGHQGAEGSKPQLSRDI